MCGAVLLKTLEDCINDEYYSTDKFIKDKFVHDKRVMVF